MNKPKKIIKEISNIVLGSTQLEQVLAFMRTAKIPILESSFKKVTEHLMSGVPVMFISADRKNKSDSENKYERRELMKDIIFNDLSYIPMSGAWKNPNDDFFTYERSFMVTGWIRKQNEYVMDFNQFKKLGLQWREDYDQDSVIIGQGKNGKYNFVLYSINREYGNIERTKFNDVDFATPEQIEAFYKKYLDWKMKSCPDYEPYGFGYSSLKEKSDKAFAFRTEDETEFKNKILEETVIFGNFYGGEKYFSNGYGMYRLDNDFFKDNNKDRSNFRFDEY